MLLRLAEKAFRPSPLPFPVMHVDTGHNFGEVIEFRDRRVTGEGHKLIVAAVADLVLDTTGADNDQLAARVIEPLNLRRQPTWATTNTRRNGKNVRPSGRAG